MKNMSLSWENLTTELGLKGLMFEGGSGRRNNLTKKKFGSQNFFSLHQIFIFNKCKK